MKPLPTRDQMNDVYVEPIIVYSMAFNKEQNLFHILSSKTSQHDTCKPIQASKITVRCLQHINKKHT